jgi:ribonuclease BN (tRNA processing enzyme)
MRSQRCYGNAAPRVALGLALCFRFAASLIAAREAVPASVPQKAETSARTPTCGRELRPALQVLGSGGPLNAGGRASTSYLLWLAGRPAIIVDVGPGSVVNLARANADPGDIDAVLISHEHPDHVSDLPGLVWDEDVLDRGRALLVAGPAGNDTFPGIRLFLDRLFGHDGPFPFMQAVVSPDAAFHLDVREISVSPTQRVPVIKLRGVEISAYPVPHGKAPTLAYRFDGADFSLVLAGDQSGTDPGFSAFARNADILILHTALSPAAAGHPFVKGIGLPQQLAKLAADAGVKRVVLSHLMGLPAGRPTAADFALADRAALVRAVRSIYRGEVSVAFDLECLPLGASFFSPGVISGVLSDSVSAEPDRENQ